MNSQTLILKDIPVEKIESVARKYVMMGAAIEKSKQVNGLYTLRITVEPLAQA